MRQVFSCDFMTPEEGLEYWDILELKLMDLCWKTGKQPLNELLCTS
jgi:hypothetical protein